jgi:2-polyprenyl-6-hydroxyphenyl methylase/3-demethylubiquinone-9 3-methyltransferase
VADEARDRFVDYYAEQSQSPETLDRFRAIRDVVMRCRIRAGLSTRDLDVADVGCGAGTQSIMWALAGDRVHGMDINEKLVELARERARQQGATADFQIGSATCLPWESSSMDVCLLPELLEHVADWEPCIDEAVRVLKPGGTLYVSTTNWMCPKQQEFELPMYAWYPPPLKRYYERLAVTTRRELVNHAKYPAVHWFSFFGLRRALRARGMRDAWDRFDIMDLDSKSGLSKAIVGAIRAIYPLRVLAHVATPYTVVVAVK